MTSLLAKCAANRLLTFITFSQEAWEAVNTEILQTTLLPYAESVTMRQTLAQHYPKTI
jgi:hypothetical protein